MSGHSISNAIMTKYRMGFHHAVVALLFASPLSAQIVQGVLVGEKSQQIIHNARVSLVDDSGRVAAMTTLDSASGAFYLDAGHAGRYRLRFLIDRGGLSYSPFFTVDSNQTVEHKYVVPDWPQAVLDAFLPDDVTKEADLAPGSRAPRYPNAQRLAGRDGILRAIVVVDRDGRPISSTYRVLESDDAAFDQSVRNALDGMRFIPAEREGLKVAQVFELNVDFTFSDRPPRLTDKKALIVTVLPVTRETQIERIRP